MLNNPDFGGCGGGGRAHVPMGVDWDVIAHEFGHGIGGFADEYSVTGNYTGGEQGWINLTTITDRATTKWRQFIDPTTPLPDRRRAARRTTTRAPGPPTWSSNFDAGLFEGGGTMNTGIYRPVENCRMNGNTPEYCPVCYTSIKTNRDHETGHHFRDAHAGHFYGSRPQRRASSSRHVDPALPERRRRVRAHASAASNGCRARGSSSRTTRSWSATSTATAPTRSSSSTASTGRCPYLGLLVSDGAGGLQAHRALRRRHPRLGRLRAQRPVLRGRPQRRRQGRPGRLQRRRLVDDLRRAAAQHRQRLLPDQSLRRRHPRLGRSRAARPVLRRRPERRRPGRPRHLQRRRLVDGVRRPVPRAGVRPDA